MKMLFFSTAVFAVSATASISASAMLELDEESCAQFLIEMSLNSDDPLNEVSFVNEANDIRLVNWIDLTAVS